MLVARRLAVVLTLVPVFALGSAAHAGQGGRAGADAVIAWNANAGERPSRRASPRRGPASRVAHVRDDARRHPRRPERDRPPLASVRVGRPREAGSVAGGRGRRGRARRAGPAPQRDPGAVPAGVRRTPASRASKPTTRPRSARSPTVEPRRGASQVGQAAAAAILALRAADGSDTPLVVTDYPQGTAPGEYRFTPGFDLRVRAGLGDVTPFVLRGQLAVPSGPALRGDLAGSTPRTSTRSSASAATASPRPARAPPSRPRSPGSGSRAPRCSGTGSPERVSAAAGLDLWENARLFGLLNMALADGYIGSFDTKYHYNYWRPVTAIRPPTPTATRHRAPTRRGRRWCRLLPIPDYDSAHSVEGGAAAAGAEAVLRHRPRAASTTCSLHAACREHVH